MTSRRRLVAALAAAALVAAAAALQRADGELDGFTTAAPPSAPASDAPSVAPARGLTVTRLSSIPVTGLDPEQVDLFGDYVVWAGRPVGVRRNELLELHDLRTGTTRTLARGAEPYEEIHWARGDGDHLVYVEQGSAGWRIRLVSLSTGTDEVVARSGGGSSGRFWPVPVISWPWLVYQQPLPEQDPSLDLPTLSDLMVLDLRDGSRRRIVRQRLFMPVLDGKWLSFVGMHGQYAQDAFSVDLTDPTLNVRQLTTTGQVGGLAAGGGNTVYYEPLAGDATHISRVRTSGGEPQIVDRPGGGDLAAGNGFVAWFGIREIFLKRIDGSGDRQVVLPDRYCVICRLTANGDRLVYGEDLPNPGSTELTGRTVLHLVRITDE